MVCEKHTKIGKESEYNDGWGWKKRGEKYDLFYLFTTHEVKIINELFGGDN